MNKARQSNRQSFIGRPSRRTYFDGASAEEPLEDALVRLQRTTERLRLARIFASVLTSLNILGVLFMFELVTNMFGFVADSVKSFMVFTGFAALMNLVVIILFENLRKEGDRLFEKISDELHWYLGYRKQKDNGTATNERPPLDARVILRAFARVADLPLIPGKFGPAVYAGVNVVIALLFLYFRLKS